MGARFRGWLLVSAALVVGCEQGDGPAGAAACDGDEGACGDRACIDLEAPRHGSVSAVDGTATYECGTGYRLIGSVQRECADDGNWSGYAPRCEATCADPEGMTHGTVEVVDGEARYFCDTGFKLMGSQTRRCTEGSWAGEAPTCQAMDCDEPEAPDHGEVSVNDSTAEYTCDTGYRPAGTSTRTCGSNGSWSGLAPTCEPVDCGAPTAPTNGSVNAPATTLASLATFECDTGFARKGSQTANCKADGKWDTAPTCEAVTCPALTRLNNGSLPAVHDTGFGSMVTYQCDDGYLPVTTDTVTCGEDGEWSDTPSCMPTDCGAPPVVDNGSWPVGAPTGFGSVVTVKCTVGYTPVGGPITCGPTGTWSAAPACAPVDCGPVIHATVTNVVTADTTFGSTSTYECATGYRGPGGTLTCNEDGNWSAPECEPVDACAEADPLDSNPCNDRGDRHASCSNVGGGSEAYVCECGRGHAPGTTGATCKRLSSLSTDYHHVCGIRKNGKALCWGSNDHGAAVLPEANTFVQVETGNASTCGLERDGSVHCWGLDTALLNTPTDTVFTEISSGASIGCGLTADHDVVCWGALAVETDDGDFVQVDASGTHACGLHADGIVECWGNDTAITDGPPDKEISIGAPEPEILVAVAVGGSHACGLRPDGTMLCWGTDSGGEITDTPKNTTFVDLALSPKHTCGVLDDGTAECWGTDVFGETLVPNMSDFVKLAAGVGQTCGLRETGEVTCWGDPNSRYVPSTTPYSKLALGTYHTCGIRSEDGGVDCWGADDADQLDAPLGEFVDLAAGEAHNCAVNTQGQTTCWGRNDLGQSNDPAVQGFDTLALIGRVSCGLVDGDAFCWGEEGYEDHAPKGQSLALLDGVDLGDEAGFFGIGTDGRVHIWSNQGGGVEKETEGILQLDMDRSYVCVVQRHPTVPSLLASRCDPFDRAAWPVSIPPESFMVSTGFEHVCVLHSSELGPEGQLPTQGEIFCAGTNTSGQRNPPGGDFYSKVYSGGAHSCALRADGTATCWGADEFGQNAVPTDVRFVVGRGL